MKAILSTLGLIVLLWSCEQKPASVPGGKDLTGFETMAIEGTNSFYAAKYGPQGNLLEEGLIVDGLQDGSWIEYWPDGDEQNKIKTVTTFVNGKINGPYLEFNNRGQVEKKSTFINDQTHGISFEYKFGRPIKEYRYNKGYLDGVSREFTSRGELTKETNYKNGQLDGPYRQYDEEGNKVLEYEYKNGEKVSGGIVGQE